MLKIEMAASVLTLIRRFAQGLHLVSAFLLSRCPMTCLEGAISANEPLDSHGRRGRLLKVDEKAVGTYTRRPLKAEPNLEGLWKR